MGLNTSATANASGQPKKSSFLSVQCAHPLTHVRFVAGTQWPEFLLGMIMGRTFGACQLKASNLGITRETSQYATITTKCGRVLSTKTGLPVEEAKPKQVSIKTKANRTPKSVSGKSVINLGKGVRNVSISYTEQGEMQITFEG
jgi:hypothetical protein